MNEKYYVGKTCEEPLRPRGLVDAQCAQTDRSPMMPLLLNDLNGALSETAALVDGLEKQLDPITSPEDSVPSPPENKEPTCFPPALEMLRSMLRRTQTINRQMASLRRRVEI